MRIKDYADSLGVSSQSIYKRIRSTKYKERLKGHLYLDNQKVENLDLIGIRILEDYHFENDVIKLEKELEEAKEQGKQLEQDLQLLKGYRKSDQQNLKAWTDYAERLEQHRFYLMLALTTVPIAFLVALAFAVF
ncbi:hypothetical protein [Streptococcus sp. 20925_1_69]|uniref:hypothetical protein n=1 Tax=Streptococcus sp. 20925_1_69 TaxID=3003661 RepID=UPI00352ED39E